jgi:glucokinase
MTNHAWAFSIEALRLALGLERLVFINDFTALALALPRLGGTDLEQIGGGTPQPGAPLALLGAGTGLGVSGLIPCGAGWQPLAGEGGHVSLAAGNAREAAIIAVLAARFGHVSAERALSGPGIAALHDAIRQLEGAPPCPLDSREIGARALVGSCPYCSEALEVFCALLGSVAADLAFTLGARGGVYVGGGIVPALGGFFERSGFRARFEAKGRFSAYLAGIPTYVIRAPYAALSGADEALDRATPAPPMPPEATQ